MRWLRKRLARADDGFTLIELIVTVAIMTVISSALIGVVLIYLKTATQTRTRLAESTDQQFVSTYWQADVASLGKRSFSPGAADPVPSEASVVVAPGGGCGSSAGTVVVRLDWTEFNVVDDAHAWNTSEQAVAYVKSGTTLKRVRCKGGAEGRALVVAHSLDPATAPSIACTPSCGPALPEKVALTLAVRNAAEGSVTGYTTTLTADRRQG
jgi:prepilin-type N-terminal cleavage/methylation domain-containing protein